MVAATARKEQLATEKYHTISFLIVLCLPIHLSFLSVFCYSDTTFLGSLSDILPSTFPSLFLHQRPFVFPPGCPSFTCVGATLTKTPPPSLWLVVVLFWERWITVVAVCRAEQPNKRCWLEHGSRGEEGGAGGIGWCGGGICWHTEC